MEYILHHLENMGYCSSGGMGLTPLSFSEIKAYMNITNTPLNPSEVMIIRRASQSYVSQLQDKSPLAKEPYTTEKKQDVGFGGIYAVFGIDPNRIDKPNQGR